MTTLTVTTATVLPMNVVLVVACAAYVDWLRAAKLGENVTIVSAAADLLLPENAELASMARGVVSADSAGVDTLAVLRMAKARKLPFGSIHVAVEQQRSDFLDGLSETKVGGRQGGGGRSFARGALQGGGTEDHRVMVGNPNKLGNLTCFLSSVAPTHGSGGRSSPAAADHCLSDFSYHQKMAATTTTTTQSPPKKTLVITIPAYPRVADQRTRRQRARRRLQRRRRAFFRDSSWRWTVFSLSANARAWLPGYRLPFQAVSSTSRTTLRRVAPASLAGSENLCRVGGLAAMLWARGHRSAWVSWVLTSKDAANCDTTRILLMAHACKLLLAALYIATEEEPHER
ncbi:hypothetical protein U1Q18_051569 [Sarracenia purpurea var. burkii]